MSADRHTPLASGDSGTLGDAAARDRIATDLDSTLFVDAGAGSGKTAALIGRLLNLIAHGTPLSRITAITFTEAAAAELRVRLRRELERAAVRGEPWAPAALGDLDGAALCTLHSFAQRILRSAPLQAGLPPEVEVRDAIESELAAADRADHLLDRWWDEMEFARVMVRLDACGIQPRTIRSMIRLLDNNWDRLEGCDLDPPPVTEIAVAPVIEAVVRALEMRSECRDESDRLLQYLDTEVANFGATLITAWQRGQSERSGDADVDEAVSDVVVLGALNSRKLKPGNKGGAKAWTNKAAVVEAIREIERRRAALVDSVGSSATAVLVADAAREILRTAEQRRRSGRLEFHDLLVLCRRVLRSDAQVRQRVHETYDRLLLDEFQDTDPIQIELAILIASGPAARPSHDWFEQEIEPGRLFFVGDPKQSIYRFRRADISLYLRSRARFADGLCELTTNFRTVHSIVEWVNAMFTALMPPALVDEPSMVEPNVAYARLAAARADQGGVEPVVLLGGPREGSAAEIREAAASELALALRGIVDAATPIVDPELGSTRAVRLGDICVLLPSRTALPDLERALTAEDLPYRLETRSLIWTTQDVRDVMSILQAIDDPTDEIALVAALRTPSLGCADDELAAWRGCGGAWDLHAATPEELVDSHVAAAMNRLRGWRRDLAGAQTAAIVQRVIREGNFFELAAVDPRARDRFRRLRFLSAAAGAFSEDGRGDLRAFLRWTTLQASDTVRVSEPSVYELDDDAIRIMTIHGAKGLEFPVCALFGLSTKAHGQTGPAVLWDESGNPEVKLSGVGRTEGFDALLPADEQMSDQERVRLLYVAATRARDHLIVSLTHSESQKGSLAARLWSVLSSADVAAETDDAQTDDAQTDDAQTDDAQTDDAQTDDAKTQPHLASLNATSNQASSPTPPVSLSPQAVRSAASADEIANLLEHWSVDRDRRLAADPPLVCRPSEIAELCERSVGADAGRDGVDLGGTGDNSRGNFGIHWDVNDAATGHGSEIGTATHTVLETVDLVALDGLEALAFSVADQLGIGELGPLVARLARSAATSPTVVRLVGSEPGRRFWRELPVTATAGSVMLEGVIDLVGQEPDGTLHIVDYKTDAITSEEHLDALSRHYQWQLAAYAEALTVATGLTVSGCTLVFASPARPVERRIGNLAKLREVVQSLHY
jgi:ATP-dependent exoDNAse (exonuclease V) beta subunit